MAFPTRRRLSCPIAFNGPLRASVHHASPAKSVAVTRLHQPAVDSARDEFVTPADVTQARAGASPSLKNDIRKAFPVARENECI